MRRNSISFDRATYLDACYVGANARVEDVNEMRALQGDDVDFSTAVVASWMVSRDTCFACHSKGQPIAIFGVRKPTILDPIACPWMIATDRVRTYPSVLLKTSTKVVKFWREEFSFMQNFSLAENVSTTRWLQWVGFDVYYPRPFGVKGLPFHRFEMRRT